MAIAAQLAPVAAVWFGRLRFVLAVAVLWAGLHFLTGPAGLGNGSGRLLVLSAGSMGLLSGLLFAGLLWVGAAVATLLVGTQDRRQPLLTIGLALMLWAGEGWQRGGTMDAWLILRHPIPGPPTGAPYWLLLADYAWLLLGVGGAYLIGRRLAGDRNPPPPAESAARGRANPPAAEAQRRNGPLALVLAVVIAGVLAVVLTGPPMAETRRGQVYFALLVGFLAAVFVTGRMVEMPSPAWCWPAPFVLGVIGLVVAGFEPAVMLGSGYAGLDTIPAWALARPLPVEMIGAGLVGVLWLLGPRSAPAAAGR